MVPGRHGVVALLIGFLLSLFLHLIAEPPPPCPVGDCPLPAPAGMRGVDSSTTSLRLAWAEVPQAFAYRVQLATNPEFNGDDVISRTTQAPSAGLHVVFTALQPGTTYHARVSALDKELKQQSKWTAPTHSATKGAMNLSVGTYNIRNPDETWPERAPWVAEGIVGQKVHVLGVQEAYQPHDRLSLLQHVNSTSTKAGMGPVYAMAPAAESPLGYDSRVLYDTRIVSLLRTGAKKYDRQSDDSEVDRWFSWAMFEHRRSGWDVLFMTTHMAPGDDEAGLQQWKELLARVNALKASFNPRWVVIAGDFNTTKFEPPAEVMLPRMHAAGFGDVLGQQYRSYETRGARAQVREDAWLNSFNGFRRDVNEYDVDEDHNGNSVDWIFASNDLRVPYYRVYARYDDDDLEEPIPSDHFMIWASLAYVPPPPPPTTVRAAATTQ